MPVTLSVDHVRKTATATAIGPIAIGDVREHLDAERIRGGLPYREFIDATRATAVLSVTGAHREAEVFNLVLGGTKGFIAGDFLVRSKPPAPEPRPAGATVGPTFP